MKILYNSQYGIRLKIYIKRKKFIIEFLKYEYIKLKQVILILDNNVKGEKKWTTKKRKNPTAKILQ